MDHQELPQFFYEIFDSSLPRLGPGDVALTRKALNVLLSVIPHRNELRILDIGCGNGGQTVQVAQNISGAIMAVDNHQPYLDELGRRAEAGGVSQNIRICLRDARQLMKDDGPFDLIWSEGALYVMGFREGPEICHNVLAPEGGLAVSEISWFREGLEACHGLLVPGGGLAVSELTWFRPDPPAECRQFFANAYPPMVDLDTNLATIRSCGYEILSHFTFPESAWWGPFYTPLEHRLQSLRAMYAADSERIEMIESIQMEIDIYRKYSDYYGYAFYVAQRR